MAFWPRWMLACEDWTLTQSSGWSAVDVELGLALELGVGLALELGVGRVLELGVELAVGLAAMRASSEAAETVADGDADAGLDWVGEAELDGEAGVNGEAEPEDEAEPDGEGRAVLTVGWPVGLPVGLSVEAGLVGVTLTDGVGSGDGVVVRLGLGVGVGAGVLADGSTWQFEPALAEAVLREPACALPDQAVSAPRITRPPARKLSVVARRCVGRTSTNLSTLLVTVTAGLYVLRNRPGDGWGVSTHIRSSAYLCVSKYAGRGGPL